MNISERVKELVAEHSGIRLENIKEDSRLTEDLGMDSLDAIELTMGVEEEYGLHITDEEAETMVTVKMIISYVTRRKNEEANLA